MPVATLIGDVVGSGDHRDPAVVHRRIRTALDRTNALLEPAQHLAVTVGDEFQGCFSTVGDAVRASLLVRLLLVTAEDGLRAHLLHRSARRRPGSRERVRPCDRGVPAVPRRVGGVDEPAADF